jgi:hypothetical protein
LHLGSGTILSRHMGCGIMRWLESDPCEHGMKSPGMRTQTWLALAVVVVGLACIAAGVSLLLPGSKRAVVSWLVTPTWTDFPTATLAATQVPTGTPTWTPTHTPESTATSTPTHTPQPARTLVATSGPTSAPAPTSISESGDTPEGPALALTIVHTNDTWGYTRPCG